MNDKLLDGCWVGVVNELTPILSSARNHAVDKVIIG